MNFLLCSTVVSLISSSVSICALNQLLKKEYNFSSEMVNLDKSGFIIKYVISFLYLSSIEIGLKSIFSISLVLSSFGLRDKVNNSVISS